MGVSDTEILHAALRAWDHWGFSRCTLRRIGESAGVAEQTLLQRFGSKSGLMKSAVALGVEEFSKSWSTSGELPEDIAGIAEAFAHLFRRRGRLILDVALEASRDPEIQEMAYPAVEALTKAARAIAAYQESGELRGTNPWEPLLALAGPMLLPALQRDPHAKLFPNPSGNVEEFLAGWATSKSSIKNNSKP